MPTRPWLQRNASPMDIGVVLNGHKLFAAMNRREQDSCDCGLQMFFNEVNNVLDGTECYKIVIWNSAVKFLF